MHYYHIRAYARSGGFVEVNETRQYGFSPGNKVLLLDADDSELDFFETLGADYFVTDALKVKMENFPFPELRFLKLDALLTSPGSKDEREGLSENSFWKVEIPSFGELRDFYLWDKRFLVVSDRALKFLMKNNGYEDVFNGLFFGPDYTVLTNRFFIPNMDLDTYFQKQYLIDSNIVKDKERRNMNEYRRRQGLPPLP